MTRTTTIIPNYNGKAFLEKCIDALATQQPVSPRIIVVDNCSSDGSVEFVAERYPDVTVIKMDHNTGFGAAVNEGIRNAETEFVALVNNDATVQPGWLATLEAFLDDTPSAGGCAPKVIFEGTQGIIDCCGDACTPYGFVFKHGHYEKDQGQYDEVREVFSVSAVATLYRKTFFDTIGLFDENFFAYYEDLDICFRGRLAGYKFFCNPGALSFHRYSATSGSQMKLGTEQVYIHITGIWLKVAPAPLVAKHIFSILIFHSAIVAAVIMAKVRNQSRLPDVMVFKLLFQMLKQRSSVKKLSKVSWHEIESMMDRTSVWSALFSRFTKAIGKTSGK